MHADIKLLDSNGSARGHLCGINNHITDDGDQGLRSLGDLEGFLLGWNEGSPVGASAGASEGNFEDQEHRLMFRLKCIQI